MSGKLVYIDTPAYLTENTSATYADLMQYCVKPALEEIFPDAVTYFLSGSNPCVGLPLFSETVSSNKLYLRCNKTATDTVTTSTMTIEVYLGGEDFDNAYQYSVSGGSYSGGNNSSQNPKTTGWYFKHITIDDGYCFGFKGGDPDNGSTPYIVTKFKYGNSYIDGLVVPNASDTLPFKIGVYIDGALRSDTMSIQKSSTQRSGLGQVFPLQMQDYKHDYLYFYSGANTSLATAGMSDYDLLRQETYFNTVWKDSAFTIDEQGFDVMICTDNHTSSYSGIGFCKKHIAENPNP